MAKSRFSTVNFGTDYTGLATVGYTLYNNSGSVYQARVTSDIVEFGSTGIYGAKVNLPTDNPVMVLWDTGGGTPVYGSEENNTQLDEIQDQTDRINLIWNSIKNQGEFFSKVMDKFGLLEKNKGLTKPEVKEIVDGIKFPSPTEVKIPDFPKFPEFPLIPNYSNQLSLIKDEIKGLSDTLSSIQPQVSKIDTKGISNSIDSLSKKVDDLPKYDSQFENMSKMLDESVSKLSDSISKSKYDDKKLSELNLSMVNELKKLQFIFSRFDSLVTKITELNKKLSEGIDSNDKSIILTRKSINEEIKALKSSIFDQLKLIEDRPVIKAETEKKNTLIRTFGRS